MVTVRNVHRPLVTLVLVGATLLVLRTAWAQTAPNAGATNIVKNRRAGTISDSDLRVVAASMDEGRAALKRSSFREAIQLFTKALGYPENQYSAEAQELLGVARQRSGQLAQARAAYEDYLRRYPGGEGSERVKQRLAGIVTAQDDAGAPLRVPATPRSRPIPPRMSTIIPFIRTKCSPLSICRRPGITTRRREKSVLTAAKSIGFRPIRMAQPAIRRIRLV